MDVTLYKIFLGAVCAIPLLLGAWTIYSVYFGPLAQFPGPKLAAATLWYEFYYDVILEGQYTFKIKELHKKYGMFGTYDLSYSTWNEDLAYVQARLFESVPTSSTLTNPITTKNYTLNISPETNTLST